MELQRLHNRAMRAALGCRRKRRKRRGKTFLLRKTGQRSVLELSLRAVTRHAGLGMGKLMGGDKYVLRDLIKEAKHSHNTRNASRGHLPVQDSAGTLISAMAKI